MHLGQGGGSELTSCAVSAAVTWPTYTVSSHVVTDTVLRTWANLLTSDAIVTSWTRCTRQHIWCYY